MLTLQHFKLPGLRHVLADFQGVKKYSSAYDILTKINSYTEKELKGEIGTVSVLMAMLAEYLRSDAQTASVGTISYLYNLKTQIKAQPVMNLTLFELMMFQEMVENIEKVTVQKVS